MIVSAPRRRATKTMDIANCVAKRDSVAPVHSAADTTVSVHAGRQIGTTATLAFQARAQLQAHAQQSVLKTDAQSAFQPRRERGRCKK